jgi:hypothetical protein
MATRIDHNGKTFTDVVRKEKVPAVVQTTTQRLRGYVFCDPEERLKDQLNGEGEQFIAIADAEVLDDADQVMHRVEFLTVNKQHIVWLLPVDVPHGKSRRN